MILKNRNKGFTLLEMVVTIGIISILVAAGVPAFNSYNKNNAAKISATDIKSTLLEAQGLARSPDKEETPDFYYVSININQNDADKNGRVELGKGVFNDEGKIDTRRAKKSYKINSDAWIIDASPRSREEPDSDEVVYYYLVPTGEMLFNGLEPSPVLGYSLRCKFLDNKPGCHYSGGNSKGYVQIKTADEAESGDETVVIDARGGNIEIIDEIINP